ncbi:hypothetical protein GCM10022281_01000 [Sphingomonas rosea]|uniref:TonB-dependent receptor plug domain-containing protein n=1 Tax=Sphingomonas rosea TaxID=335605 RepID=A0ABP7THI2_9SPHN
MSRALFRSALLAGAILTPTLARAVPPSATDTGAIVYTPADFARFAPRTALDMLNQLPGFTIRSEDGGRGLGQATENVLINGQRVANKSGGAIDELQRTNAASVERIELVDAARLGIAGLSGQVANVVLKAEKKGQGQFEWKPQIRAHYAYPRIINGSASWSDKAGPFDYKLSVQTQGGRGAFGGPITITDGAGNVIERRSERFRALSELPRFAATTKIDGWGSSEGNVTLAYTPYWTHSDITDRRVRADGDNRTRFTKQRQSNGSVFDANADYSFALGPGRLKVIGVHKFDHEPTDTVQTTRFDSGRPDEGVRFFRLARISETIGRAEYDWKIGRNSFQLSLERADNRLDQRGRLSLLDPAGNFVEQEFPGGSGIVQERRYESLLTFSRALSPKLDVQLVGGGEISKLKRVDGNLPARKFFRPKGSLTLGWRPSAPWDVSLKFNRKVGQISFYDFLSQPRLAEDRQNSGNPDLVPPQSWEAELEVGRKLGPWGQTRLRAFRHWITDIIDIIPIGEDGDGVGNLPRASETGFEWTSTFTLDPMGFKGAKLDTGLFVQRTRVRDPLTGDLRPISGSQKLGINVGLRHDIPGSKWAWGVSANHNVSARDYYLNEIGHGWEGPWFDEWFVENKDVAGLKVRATVVNLSNARHRNDRLVYAGRRNVSPLLFRQQNNQLIGPIFMLSVQGSF